MLVRLEMDEERMTLPLLNSPPSWAELLSLAAFLAAGVALGMLYFHSLWWNARRIVGGDRAVLTIVLTIGRFVVLGGVLTLASLQGAAPLLMISVGLFIGRYAVMRRVRKAAP